MGKEIENKRIREKVYTNEFAIEKLDVDDEQYKDEIIELMCKHYEFYAQFHSINMDYIEHALRGAKLSCTHGNKYIYLDTVKDHGVYDGVMPVMTCEDCKLGQNIYNFGACGNDKYEPLYNDDAPHPSETVRDKNGKERYKCFPILLAEWGHGDINVRSTLIGQDNAGNQYKNEPDNNGKPSEYMIYCIEQTLSKKRGSGYFIMNMNKYVHALMTCDNLLCLYGGVITIEENPEQEEKIEIEESLEWIPKESMKLNGTTPEEEKLKKWIDSTNANCKKDVLKWNQDKIDAVWEACKEFYEEYGVQVDPRLLISIICAEGNGSFNTNSINLAADGQNGPQEVFEADLDSAIDVVGGKVIAYAYYKDDFSAAREKAYQNGLAGIKDYDDILHYLNWATPRVSTISKQIIYGNYAGKNEWNRDVRQVYGEIAFDGAASKYTEYAISLKKEKLEDIAKDMGITIPSMQFEASRDGMDHNGNPNGEYVIKVVKK